MIEKGKLRTISSVDEKGVETILFLGPLDEEALEFLPSLRHRGAIFDCSKIGRVSSSGAEMWIRWLRAEKIEDVGIVLRGLPPNFVRVANSVSKMIPLAWKIESFYVPYVGAETADSQNVLFVFDKNFTPKELFLSPLVTSLVDDQKLELDVDPERYFRFLRAHFPDLQIKRQGL